MRSTDAFSSCEVTATELLSGLSAKGVLETCGGLLAETSSDLPEVHFFRTDDLKRFDSRRQEPLTIGLTDQQAVDPEMIQLAQTLAAHYRALGRSVELGHAEPNQLILSRQPYVMTQPYPQWKTVESDLVLFGSPNNNVLLMDQDRGCLLPPGLDGLEAGQSIVCSRMAPALLDQ